MDELLFNVPSGDDAIMLLLLLLLILLLLLFRKFCAAALVNMKLESAGKFGRPVVGLGVKGALTGVDGV